MGQRKESKWFNKLWLIVVYVFGISLTTLFMKLFNPFMMNNSIDHVIYFWQIPIIICCIWSIVIFVHDVIHHRLFVSKTQILLWVMDLAMLYSTYLQGVFSGPIWSPGFAYQAMKFGIVFMFTTTFFSAAFQYSREQFGRSMIILAKMEVLMFTMMNVISLFFYALGVEWLQFLGNPLRIFLEARGTRFSLVPDTRLIGLYPLPTLLGFRNTMTTCLALYLAENKKLATLGTIIIVGISFFTVLQANCRAALLGFVVIFLYGIYKWVKSGCILFGKSVEPILKQYLWKWIVVFCVAFLMTRIPSIVRMFTIIKEDPYTTLNKITSLRLEIWFSAIRQGCTRPLIGFGYMLPMEFWSMNPGNCVENAHNILVNLFTWGGLVALIPGSIALFKILISVFKNTGNMGKSHTDWLGVMTICVLIQGMLDVNILGSEVPESALYWVFAGLALSFGEKCQGKKEMNETN